MTSLREIPSVDHLLHTPPLKQAQLTYGTDWVAQAARLVLENVREDAKAGMDVPEERLIIERIENALAEESRSSLRQVINATGVLLHTNLGRAPLAQEAIQAMAEAARGYLTLEYELESGSRGRRETHAENQLTVLTGAEAALVVNNNAGAVLLALSALANRKMVAISRSQLVEIGGSFRIPDVMRQSGAKLMEVGTTNRTHLADFEAAIGEGARLLMAAHPSNFRISGFTAQPELPDLAELAHSHDLPLFVDLGSGALVDTAEFGLAHEPTVQECLSAGADLVSFSGDKLLGGPQAGILVGKKEIIDKLKKHPLYRALRPDKVTLAGLEATLLLYRSGHWRASIPLYRMLATSLDSLKARAEAWQKALSFGDVLRGLSTVGGGSLPEESLPTWLLALPKGAAKKTLDALRAQDPPVIGRIQDGQVMLDPRTVQPEQDQDLIAAVKASVNR